MKLTKLIILSILITLLAKIIVFAKMNGPFPKTSQVVQTDYEVNPLQLVLKGSVLFFSKFISPLDGPRSPSYPTGSAYGLQTIKKYGFWGIFLTADRLIHEVEAYHGTYILKHGVKRYYDPVEANTYWWENH